MIRFCIFCAFVLLTFTKGKAQERYNSNLSQLHISAGYMPVLQFSPDYLDYHPSAFTRLTLGLNYQHGYIQTHFQYAYLPSSDPQKPDTRIFDNSLAYLYTLPVYKGLSIRAGGQIGLNTIHFQTDVAGDRSFETEVSGGFEAGIELRVMQKLGLIGSYKLQRIFATPRNNLSMIDVGAVYYFNSNQTLKKWLE
jgi:predicted porin